MILLVRDVTRHDDKLAYLQKRGGRYLGHHPFARKIELVHQIDIRYRFNADRCLVGEIRQGNYFEYILADYEKSLLYNDLRKGVILKNHVPLAVHHHDPLLQRREYKIHLGDSLP